MVTDFLPCGRSYPYFIFRFQYLIWDKHRISPLPLQIFFVAVRHAVDAYAAVFLSADMEQDFLIPYAEAHLCPCHGFRKTGINDKPLKTRSDAKHPLIGQTDRHSYGTGEECHTSPAFEQRNILPAVHNGIRRRHGLNRVMLLLVKGQKIL